MFQFCVPIMSCTHPIFCPIFLRPSPLLDRSRVRLPVPRLPPHIVLRRIHLDTNSLFAIFSKAEGPELVLCPLATARLHHPLSFFDL